jgi:V-type H+-transporting ATPase subunit H
LEVNKKDEVLKNILALINDLLIALPGQEFIESLLSLSKVDNSLPYQPFLKHLDNNDLILKTLSSYNLIVLLAKANKVSELESKIDKEVVIRLFDVLSNEFIANTDANYQIIGVQLLQELLVVKKFKLIYEQNNLITNFKPICQLIVNASKSPNSIGLQLCYNVLLVTWILSYSAKINKNLIHNNPQLIGNLLTIAKDSIKLKIVRISVAILKNFISIGSVDTERFKTIKILLFHDAIATINILKERKFASNGSDEELSNDLQYLSDELNEVVTKKLTSLDEYLTELENPNLISWSSPTHKSSDFWLENSGKFKDSNYKLAKRMFEILSSTDIKSTTTKVILLNDIQFLIKNLGQEMVTFIKTEKSGQYRLLIMDFLDNNQGDNELKYEALKTIQLLVGHNF